MALVTFLQPLFNTQGIVPGQRATSNYILPQTVSIYAISVKEKLWVPLSIAMPQHKPVP